MAINFWRWLTGKDSSGGSGWTEVEIQAIQEAAQELNIRIMALNVCINIIANAVSKCEFKTYRAFQPIREQEYYLLNIEPNCNQNSTAFWHEFIYRLCFDNEVLCIDTKDKKGKEMLVVADSFAKPDKYPAKQNEYKAVTVGQVAYKKTFREEEVLHLKLNHKNMQPMIDGIYGSYSKLLSAAQKSYTRSRGVRLKVKVDQVSSGAQGFDEEFKKLMDKQLQPWINADSGALPEFEGYEYTDMNKDSTYKAESTRDIKAMIDDIFAFTARCMGLPPVLVTGDVADTKDALTRALSTCIDPLCDQIQEELNRKRYGYSEWVKGNFVQIDTSTIVHFDLFANAASVEKLIGSGAFSINDVLEAAGRPTIEEAWANKHYMTLNITAMEGGAQGTDHGGEGGKGA